MDVSDISDDAREAAELLLDAFYLQDARETFLLAGDAERARLAAETATDRMSKAFRTEFPSVEIRRAETAGREFMRALFLQDEIENWADLRAQMNDALSDVVVSDPGKTYALDVNADPRWERVRSLLLDTCMHVGIDPEYAELQSRFWRLHGQRADDWSRYAFEAHRLKVRAMVADCDPDDVEALARDFVVGVQLHDAWERRNRDDDFSDILALAAGYYQRIFDLLDRDDNSK